jgi:pimeloyl-ACP methyl ester carboxylesterase
MMLRAAMVLVLAASVSIAVAQSAPAELLRKQFVVPGGPLLQLAVTEVRLGGGDPLRPLLLVHGARVPGLASFDLPVGGGSLAADLAQRGFDVYIMDVRGYGGSTRPAEMAKPPSAGPALVRSNEAAADIGSVIDFILERRQTAGVALLGWATGGQWAGLYASLHPEKLTALMVLNSLYRGSSAHALIGQGSALENTSHPGHYARSACGNYRYNDAASIARPWDNAAPPSAREEQRDEAVVQAYVSGALASDSSSAQRTPPSFRSPCGAMEDSFYLATGRQLWDASLITAPTLVLRGERDFWSRPEDARNLVHDLTHASRVRMVELPGASHFVHLERAAQGRARLLQEVDGFVH